MREDPSQSTDFKDSSIWQNQRYEEVFLVPPDATQTPVDVAMLNRKFISNSLSGNERNRMFLRCNDDFADVSLVSGTDDLADGRSFGVLDFDRDGWSDIALMTLNVPRFKLYRNQMKAYFPDRRALRIRLTGGQTSSAPSEKLSNRDAVGAKVLITFESGRKVMLHKQAGEGFASQNSETLTIGCPTSHTIDRLDVKWPSGNQTSVERPDISEIINLHELER